MSVSVLNTTSGLSGKTLVLAESTATITGLHTFDLDPSAPFAVTSGSAAVTNLDADKLDGQDGTYYTNATNLASGTVPAARLTNGVGSMVCNGRLSLTAGVAVTTADVTAAGTLYFIPYFGNGIALHDGTNWVVKALTQTSVAIPAVANQVYDVFYFDIGTPTLDLVAWTNDTTRATALTTQDNVYVKLGSSARRYVGTIRTTGTVSQCEDSFAKRYVWNYYNRVPRIGRVIEATDNWTYTLAAYRQANNSTANQLDFVIGVAEVELQVNVVAMAANASSVAVAVGIGEDGLTLKAGTINALTAAGTLAGPAMASLRTYPAVGRHYYAWIEWSAASGTTTWYGDNGALITQSGIHGMVLG